VAVPFVLHRSKFCVSMLRLWSLRAFRAAAPSTGFTRH
jgi:hypothetical protein